MSRILPKARGTGGAPPAPGDREVAALALDLPARIAEIDHSRLHAERLVRLRQELIKRDYAAALLFDPMNIRYATGSRNMAVWTMHGPGRYAFIAAEGPVLLFDFSSSFHVSADCTVVDEMRASTPWFYFLAGPRVPEKTARWAAEVIGLVRQCGGDNRRLAVDRCEPWGARHLMDAGIELFDAQEPLEQARMIKTVDEIKCLQLAVDVADIAIDRMRRAVRPGLTENQLWSILHQTNIAHDGEWIESRLLASGERTNPWFQECSNRVIEAGDLVSFDTDMVGPLGYLADLSRSFVCPGKEPSAEQQQLYSLAQEQVVTNMELLKPGLSLREFAQVCWKVPEEYVPRRYMMMLHGAGMVDEYPTVAYPVDWDEWGYEARLEENMVVCVESFIGAVGSKEGVKLEQQVLITNTGSRVLSKSRFIDALVA